MSSAELDPSLWDRGRIRRYGWLIVGLLGGIGFLVSLRTGLSLTAGGILSMLNAELLFDLTERATQSTPKRGMTLAIFGLGFRYILLFVGLYVIFIVWRFNILATAIGLSAPALAVLAESAGTLRREFGSNNK